MKAKESWKPVTIGSLTGILMGAGAMYAAKVTSAHELASGNQKDLVQEASLNGGLSFKEAFEAARAQVGPGGVFRWHGNIYNTYTEEEWEAMGHEEKTQFAARVSPEVSPADIDARQFADTAAPVEDDATEVARQMSSDMNVADKDHADVQVAELSKSAEERAQVSVADQSSEGDDDVRVVGFGHVQLSNGHYVAVEEVDINGQRVAVIDVDNDGVADVAMSDLNHNQQMDEGEIIDLHTGEALTFTNESEDSMAYVSDEMDSVDTSDIDSVLL